MALKACRKLIKAIEAASVEPDDVGNDEEFTVAEEDAMMTHMLDCLALLAATQNEKKKEDAVIPNRMTRNKVFVAAVAIVGESLLKVDRKERPNVAVDQLLRAFPAIEKRRRGWLPLHWAMALVSLERYDVTEADVQTLYASNPLALQTLHMTNTNDGNGADNTMGFNPVHLLCANPAVQCSMQLLRSFSLCNPTAFGSTTTTVSALHVACRHGTPTVELLQCLLQLDNSGAKAMVTVATSKHYPLGQLCCNLVQRADELPNAEDLVKCLLEVDKSKEVVGDAVLACIDSYDIADAKSVDATIVDRRNGRLYGMVEMLLKANPGAAKHRDSIGANISHRVCQGSLPSHLCIDIVKLVVALHKDAVQEVTVSFGWLPVHYAANSCDVEVMELLLRLHPEAASAVTLGRDTLLHLAVADFDNDSTASSVVSKVQYLCSRYPAMMEQRDNFGQLPVQRAARPDFYKVVLALYEAGGIEPFKTPIAHATKATFFLNGYLPLHSYIGAASHRRLSVVSEAADLFRWLLRLCPEAAGIEGGGGGAKRTPYQMAVDGELPDYYLRLLLRAAPTLNPAELHRLNYAERRMAMFLAFRASTATIQAPLLARLRGESKDLVQRVVSFL
jgi:ankyrin repeat protein